MLLEAIQKAVLEHRADNTHRLLDKLTYPLKQLATLEIESVGVLLVQNADIPMHRDQRALERVGRRLGEFPGVIEPLGQADDLAS